MLGRMKLELHHPDDLGQLRERVSAEHNALQRDRFRAVLLVAADALEGDEVARRLGRSPRFVDQWAGRYRRGGLAALTPRKPPGPRSRLAPGQEAGFKERLAAGPTDADGVCTLRGKDVVRTLEAEFGVQERSKANKVRPVCNFLKTK
jgi:transposase